MYRSKYLDKGLEKCLKLKVVTNLIYYWAGAFANNDIFVVDILLRSDFSNQRTSEQENAAWKKKKKTIFQ